MRIDPETGVIDIARQVVSPNCDERPQGSAPELLVIHNISLPPGIFGGDEIDALFTNTLDRKAHVYFAKVAEMRVSAHALIRRDGEIVQYVLLMKRAWHAGESSYKGRSSCNDYSIGIELEGTDEIPYTQPQYDRLVELTTELLRSYPTLDAKDIVGHCDIAPERKSDPGVSFDWQKFRLMLKHKMNEKTF